MENAINKSTLRNLSALVDFGNLINSSLDTKFILNNLLLTCFGKFHTTKGLFATCYNNKLQFSISKGLGGNYKEEFPETEIDDYLNSTNLKEYLIKNKLVHSQEVYSANKLIGVLFLGERLSGDKYFDEDIKFLQTFLNITATALENSISITQLKEVNRNLDNKVHQLSSLFDLSKEFGGILEIPLVSKLLGFSIIGQLLVTKYAIIIFRDNKHEIIESRFDIEVLEQIITLLKAEDITKPVICNSKLNASQHLLFSMGIELIVPMQIKQKTKGLILLGRRNTGESFTKSDIEFVSSVGGLAIISIENSILFKETLEKQKLEKDLEIAKKIQRNLLPNKLPKMNNFEIAAFNNAAKQVGGDYYDAIKLADGRILIAIADVSGKGVQAALLMANLQAFLQAISKQNKELIEASNLLNDLVSENTSDGRFITFFWGILNDENLQFESVNMGHNPPLIIRNGEIIKLRIGGMLMGVMPTITPYKKETTQLVKNDLLILFTDGITEAMDEKQNEFSDEKLEELSLKLKSNSAENSLNKILNEVNKHTKGTEQSDDITCIVIKVKWEILNRLENIFPKYRSKIIAPLVLLLSVLVLIQFYFIFEITPQPNDECLWIEQEVSKDSIGYFFDEVKFNGVTWNAGIRDGDQLLKISNKPIRTLSEASYILNSMSIADSAIYTVSRDGEIFETKVEVKKLIQFGGLSFALLGLIWLIVGFIVIKSKENGETHIIFFGIGIAFVFFASFNLLISSNIKNPLFNIPILIQIVDHLWTIGILFLPFLIVKFFWIFPNKIERYNKVWLNKALYAIPSFMFAILVYVKYKFVYPGAINSIYFYSIISATSIILVFVAAVIGFISLFSNYLRIENKKDRKPIFLILVAYAIGILAAIYSFILVKTGSPAMMYNQPEFFMPIILVALLPIAFAYSIFKYSLLDVSDVVKTTLLYGLATVSIAATYFLVIYLLGQTLSTAIGTEYQGLIAGIIFVAFAIIFQSTKDKFQNLIIKKFYPEQFAYQQVLIKFSNDVLTIFGLENILKSTTNTFVESLKLAVFGIALKSNNSQNYELKESVGINQDTFKLNSNESELLKYLLDKKTAKQPVVIEDSEFNAICPNSANILIEHGIYTVIPLIIKNKIIGLLLFGLKYSGSRFAGKDIELLTATANQTAVAIENARLYESEREKLIIDNDLENARKIQKSLLPASIPKIKGLDINGAMISAMQVGGDYFDVIKVSDSKVFVIVGDVSGKGLAASFYMSKLQTMVRLYCNETNTPYNVLSKINFRIYKEMEKNWFITATVALFDIESKSVKICRAGHTSTVLVNNGNLTEITPSGIGLGLEEGKIFDKNLQEIELQFDEKSLFTFYSDGVTEAMNSKNEMFGVAKLNQLLLSKYELSANLIKDELLEELKHHRKNYPQNDDITFVLVKII